MTDHELEQRIRGWYRTEIDGDVAPASLRTSVAAIPRRRVRAFPVPARRTITLLAAAALTTVLVGGILVSGQRKDRSLIGPTPPPRATAGVTTPAPTDTRVPAALGLMVVYQPKATTADIYLLDPATGARTDLVTVGRDPDGSIRTVAYTADTTFNLPDTRLQWSVDRKRVTIFHVTDGEMAQAQLDIATLSVKKVGGFVDLVSPDGLMTIENLDNQISIRDLDGHQLRTVGRPAALAGVAGGQPWSPDQKALLFTDCDPCSKGPELAVGHLYLVPVDGSPSRRLASAAAPWFGPGPSWQFTSPRWSPDGSAVAYAQDGIVTLRVGDGVATKLTTNEGDISPIWSPDGRRIAFVRARGTGQGIWVINADGTGVTRLTTAETDFGDRQPVWSPDGSSIAFTRGLTSVFGDVWIVPSAGGTPRLLIKNATADW